MEVCCTAALEMNRTACATDGSTAAAGGALNGAASAAAAGAAGAAVGLVAGASGEAPGSEPRSQGLAFGGAAGAAGAAIAAGAVGAAIAAGAVGAAGAAIAAGAVGAADAGSAAACIASRCQQERLSGRRVRGEEKKRAQKGERFIPVRVVVPFTNAMQELPLYQSPPSHEKLQHATPALSYQHSDTHTHTDHPRPHPGQALPWTFDYFSSPARAVPRSQGEP